ncbi:carcinoembryonic antigen-related cell adhesion molecule 1-like isoform X2 [Xyrichtys novacula]|uniref:Carcinoembryonic antigen-related cell adhesion molecule 1-like isoform X2 n=1 Tax=Xyrichtys novacula TaxID=13765 RepID=A0AAV1HM97_XYRNO|nr:carcinoembryonic antigen-related cell adhesion molecule 1-like isoform X2 [Xyrichtys novacula]
MWPSVTSVILAGLVWAWSAAVSADPGLPLYAKFGDEVVLKPDSSSGPITKIIWKHRGNMAALFEGGAVDFYRQFEERGNLSVDTGELKIWGLKAGDEGLYSVEINGNSAGSTNLTILYPVPKPTVIKACDTGGAGCFFICDGNTTGAQPFTYKWNSGGTEKTKHITKDDHVHVSDFSCELENPVSREISEPVFNPFFSPVTKSTETAGGQDISPGGLKISTGVTVFICLLTAVLLVVFIHRWKAGMWFYQKDFWRKQERPPRDAAESNGTTSRQEKGQTDEETPMA